MHDLNVVYSVLISKNDLIVLQTRQDASTFLRLHGELDLVTADQVRQSAEQALNRGCSTLVIDLRGLEFMDSSGIHAMIAIDRRCTDRGVSFVLIRGTGVVDRLLTICETSSLLDIVDGPEQLPDEPSFAIAV